MTTFSQISMKFIEDSALPRDEKDIQPVNEDIAKGDMPVNVGIRIKKLKTVPAASPAEIIVEVAENATGMADEVKPEEPVSAEPALKIKSGRGRKSIRQIAEEADLIQIPGDEILFLKQYYTMGEVADMFRVNQSLLRFWEAEFSILQPKKNKKGDRYFRPVDVKNLHLIYHLLRQRKYTIEGAKDFLKQNNKAEGKFETIKKLEEVKRFLLEMKANLR
jgi:DNA-binding transcriptional MerR regulator